MTQCERVLKYMQDFGSITQIQATADLGIVRLPSRIFDLKQAGFEIKKQMIKSKNRYGETVHFAEYSLMEDIKNA